MTYYGMQEPENIRAQIRSTRGETIDLSIPITCTLGELRNFLIDEYDYSPDTRLVFNGRPAPDTSLVNDYPYGSLLITNAVAALPQQQQQLPPRQSQPPPQSPQQQQQQQPSFQQRPTYPTGHAGQGGTPSTPPVPARKPSTSPSGQQQARTTRPKAPSPVAPKKSQPPAPPPPSTNGAPPPPPPAATTAAAATAAPAPSMQTYQRPGSKDGPPSGRDKGMSPPTDGPGTPSRASQTPSARGVRSSQESGQEGGSGNRYSNSNANRNTATTTSNSDLFGANAANPRSSRGTPRGADGAPAGAATNAPASDDVLEEKAPWQLATFTVDCIIPDLDKTVSLQVNGDASVADLILAVVAALPEVAGGAQVVYRGKVLPQTPQSKLFNFGIRSDARVFIASGRYSSPDTITLLEIENDVNHIAEAVNKTRLTDLQRKGYYENLMRILFRTDGLMELEGEWRQRRKDAVAHIKQLQDILHPEAAG